VPTMGALHKGHVSLLEKAKTENNNTVASIFVNPLQFNDIQDLKKYPRTPEKDIQLLEAAGCDILFSPSAEEMYGNDRIEKFEIDLGNLDKIMEGKSRPGHFQGVCVVVKRFLDILEPDKVYFGEKDFQQLAIIRYMVNLLSIPVSIISCPTVREPDGLAMSSRNVLLTPDQRKNASHIYKTLFQLKERKKDRSVTEMKKWAEDKIAENPFLQLDYFEIVNEETIQPVSSWQDAKNIRACIAAKVGTVRLIDNIQI
jgi:pantoate--beta-alanine ligase